MAAATFPLPVCVAVFCAFCLLVVEDTCASTSGLYVNDADMQQSVLIHEIPSSQKKVIKQEILTLLGLQKKPRPIKHGDSNSAPHYMLDLYNTLEEGSMTSENEAEEEEIVKVRVQEKKMILPGMERQVPEADMIMSFINNPHRDSVRLRHEGQRRLFFDFSEVPAEPTITGAELRLYKQATPGSKSLKIDVMRIIEGKHMAERDLALEASVSVPSNEEGWVEFNVTNAAMLWNFFPTTNLGLYLAITDSEDEDLSPRDAGIVGKRGPEDKQPFLVTFFRTAHEARIRRARSTSTRDRDDDCGPDCDDDDGDEEGEEDDDETTAYARDEGSRGYTYGDEKSTSSYAQDEGSRKYTYGDENEEHSDDAGAYGGWGYPGHRTRGNSCQKKTLYVSFKELQWQEWIIAPEGYSAYYCEGECSFPLNVHMNATNHAIVQTLVHLMSPQMVPQPSCAPTKLSGISVLFFDDNSNVILKKYKNMVVKACGCH